MICGIGEVISTELVMCVSSNVVSLCVIGRDKAWWACYNNLIEFRVAESIW